MSAVIFLTSFFNSKDLRVRRRIAANFIVLPVLDKDKGQTKFIQAHAEETKEYSTKAGCLIEN